MERGLGGELHTLILVGTAFLSHSSQILDPNIGPVKGPAFCDITTGYVEHSL